MRASLLRRLFRRSSQDIEQCPGWWLNFQRRRGYRLGWQETSWEWIACDPYLHRAIRSRVVTGHETALVTQVIYQGDTLMVWDDDKRTWTMPTAKVEV